MNENPANLPSLAAWHPILETFLPPEEVPGLGLMDRNRLRRLLAAAYTVVIEYGKAEARAESAAKRFEDYWERYDKSWLPLMAFDFERIARESWSAAMEGKA